MVANIEHWKIPILNFQIDLLGSSELTEGKLLQWQLSCSKVALHEKVLNSLKNTTIKLTKQLKSVPNSHLYVLSVKLGEICNTNDNGINEDAIVVDENEIAQVETEWINCLIIKTKTFWKTSGTSVITVHLRSNSPWPLSKRDRIYPINTG